MVPTLIVGLLTLMQFVLVLISPTPVVFFFAAFTALTFLFMLHANRA